MTMGRRRGITRFYQLMEEAGVNAVQLAKLSGVSASTIRNAASMGIEHTTVGKAWRLAHALGCGIDDMLGDAR